nr:4-coumarate--CoA ligase 1-like [Aedes albopictus]
MATYDGERKQWNGRERPSILNPEANIGQIVWNLLGRTPDNVIQIDADNDLYMTCAEMRLRIVRIGKNLRNMGCTRGDMVSLVCTNSENVVPVYIACLTIGMVVNPLAPVFNRNDLVHMMRQTQSRVIFCDEDNRATVELAALEAIVQKPLIFVMGESAGQAISVDKLLKHVKKEESSCPRYMGDSKKLLAVVLCSSGTTGLPKGVCLSHAHLIENDVFSDDVDAGPIFNFSALFWATGMFAMLTSLYNQRPRVITRKPFDADTLIDVIEKYHVEDVFTPPSYVASLVNHPRFADADFSSVKRWTMGGAIVSEELRKKLADRLPRGVAKSLYGTSEIGIVTAADHPSEHGSVGTLVSNLAVKIVDDAGRRLGPTERGEIRLKYKHKILGYLDNEEATLDAFDDEDFFKSGDIGYFDHNGMLFVVDRIKDIIKYKNYQISPSDLEAVIEKIEGVQSVCVTGVPVEDRSSDLATAVIVKKEGSTLTEEEVIQQVNCQVSDFKQLRGGVYFVERLPTSAAGKVLRRAVKELVISRLSVQKK